MLCRTKPLRYLPDKGNAPIPGVRRRYVSDCFGYSLVGDHEIYRPASNRDGTTEAYFGSSSIVSQRRPSCSAASPVVFVPAKGSITSWPGTVIRLMKNFGSANGNRAGCLTGLGVKSGSRCKSVEGRTMSGPACTRFRPCPDGAFTLS